jgi:radical SAM protein with 4Fe4S-binding SPASM domain
MIEQSTVDDAICDLQKIYDISKPFYLSDLNKHDGNKKLYEFLTSVYQIEYKNNFRIIIVQDCVDIYDYVDLPGRALCSLQKYASQLDISNFFILVLTSNPHIESELEQVQKLYSTDDCKIQSQVVDGNFTKKTVAQDTFCVLPWMHLYVGTDGNVLPCCVADQKYPMGNIEKHSIDIISKSPEFTQLRHNMISGQRSKECSRCYAQEDSGIRSDRENHNATWPNIKINQVKVDQYNPVYLDIRLNNICNLKCRMCSGYFSSAISQEEVELFGNTTYVQSSIGSSQRKLVLAEILNFLPQAESIYFAGGEPLLTAEHYEILDALIACNNTNLKINYNTNFTTLQFRSRNVLELWKNFSNIKIGASIDAFGSVAEYVRHGTVWETIESNLELVKSQCPHVNLTVTSTVGILNISSLMVLQKTWHETKKLDISKFSQNILIGPDHLTLTALPVEHKKRLEQSINAHILWCYENSANQLASQWQDVLHYMWFTDTSYNLNTFKRLISITDSHRGELLAKSVPELKNLI